MVFVPRSDHGVVFDTHLSCIHRGAGLHSECTRFLDSTGEEWPECYDPHCRQHLLGKLDAGYSPRLFWAAELCLSEVFAFIRDTTTDVVFEDIDYERAAEWSLFRRSDESGTETFLVDCFICFHPVLCKLVCWQRLWSRDSGTSPTKKSILSPFSTQLSRRACPQQRVFLENGWQRKSLTPVFILWLRPYFRSEEDVIPPEDLIFGNRVYFVERLLRCL